MPIPFPGMNPYLEHPDLWPIVHRKLIKSLADRLNQQLSPIYQIRICERHYQVSGEDSLVVGSPGLSWRFDTDINAVDAHERQLADDLELRSQPSTAHQSVQHQSAQYKTNACNHPVRPRPIQVSSFAPAPTRIEPAQQPETLAIAETADSPTEIARLTSNLAAKTRQKPPIAVLVPVPQKIYETYLEIAIATGEIVTIVEALSPKKKRRGRSLYERQRETIFGSPGHFVEIDLLRGWEPPSIYGPDESGDYRILISRSEQRPRAQLYTWNVMGPIPEFNLPLSGSDELCLDLKPIVDEACDRTDLLVNYQQSPLPPLRFEENLWLEDFLQEVGMRPCAS